jgi:hypothetical protein
VLYPIPVFLALAGFLFILFSRVDFSKEMRTSGSILFVGTIVYGIRLYLYAPIPNRTPGVQSNGDLAGVAALSRGRTAMNLSSLASDTKDSVQQPYAPHRHGRLCDGGTKGVSVM